MEKVDVMKKGVISHVVAGPNFDDCYHYAYDFIKVSFQHVLREANILAHEQARAAMSFHMFGWTWLQILS
jgi:hypothetical protein